MKLLIITAIAAFDQDIRKMLKKAQIKSYSFKEVKGYSDGLEAVESNWFGSDMHENESMLYYVFTENQNIGTLFELIEEFNASQKTFSKVHVAVLNIEKSNN